MGKWVTDGSVQPTISGSYLIHNPKRWNRCRDSAESCLFNPWLITEEGLACVCDRYQYQDASVAPIDFVYSSMID
jgi:hypothetical protein